MVLVPLLAVSWGRGWGWGRQMVTGEGGFPPPAGAEPRPLPFVTPVPDGASTPRPCTTQVNRDKHVLRGKLLALQGQGKAAAEEVAFLGQATADGMEAAGRRAAQGAGPSPGIVEMVAKKDL